MATASVPYITVDEYLHNVYRPDVDFVDGLIEERNVGEFDHADLQGELIALFRSRSAGWKIRAVPEARVQVSATRFRVPDVCIMPVEWKRIAIISQAPLLCIEVLSPEDRLPRMQQRCEDYLRMGVPEVWIFDPYKRTAFRLTGESLVEQRTGELNLAGTLIRIDLNQLFAALDR